MQSRVRFKKSSQQTQTGNITDINHHNISEKKIFYFGEILCFTQSFQLRNQDVAS